MQLGDLIPIGVEPTGSRPRDFVAANRAAGLKRTPIGYTWEEA
jgi:hypothetical protein